MWECVCAGVWGGTTNYISEIALHERHVHHKNPKVLSVLVPTCVGKQRHVKRFSLPHIVLFDHANIFLCIVP